VLLFVVLALLVFLGVVVDGKQIRRMIGEKQFLFGNERYRSP